MSKKRKKSPSRDKSAAVLTIYNAPGMTKSRRAQVVDWLRSTASLLVHSSSMVERRRFRETRTTLLLRDNWNWTKRGRKQVATWLRNNARCLEELGPQYSKRFMARYLYR